jgi:hypothetical protein
MIDDLRVMIGRPLEPERYVSPRIRPMASVES